MNSKITYFVGKSWRIAVFASLLVAFSAPEHGSATAAPYSESTDAARIACAFGLGAVLPRAALGGATSTSDWALSKMRARMGDGSVYFVDQAHPQASDKAVGSETQPWRTIRHAAKVVGPGDTVFVKEGTYPPFRILSSGRPDAPVTFAAFPGHEHRVVIDGTDTPRRGLILSRGHSHVTIYGFRVQNASTDGIFVEGSPSGARDIHIIGNQIETTGNAGIYTAGLVMGQSIGVDEYRLFDIQILGNDVSDTNFPNGGNEAISLGGGVDGFEIVGNWVHNSEQFGIDAKFGAIHGLISQNLVDGIEKHGIYVDSNSRRIQHVTISQNVVANSNNGVVVARESTRPPITPHVSDVTIRQNIVFRNNRFGIMAYKHVRDEGLGEFSEVRIEGNYVFENGMNGIHLKGIGPVATGFVLDGNRLFENGHPILNEGNAQELRNSFGPEARDAFLDAISARWTSCGSGN